MQFKNYKNEKFTGDDLNIKKHHLISTSICDATALAPILKTINEKFNILYIDVLRYEINMNLMEEYGIASAEGIPRVLVFDKNKNVINNSNTTEWRTARDRSSQEIFDFFQNMVTN